MSMEVFTFCHRDRKSDEGRKVVLAYTSEIFSEVSLLHCFQATGQQKEHSSRVWREKMATSGFTVFFFFVLVTKNLREEVFILAGMQLAFSSCLHSVLESGLWDDAVHIQAALLPQLIIPRAALTDTPKGVCGS